MSAFEKLLENSRVDLSKLSNINPRQIKAEKKSGPRAAAKMINVRGAVIPAFLSVIYTGKPADE